MSTTLTRMAREKKEDTDTVRLARSMIRRLKRISGHLDVSVPDYLADRLAGPLERDEAKMFEDLKREQEGSAKTDSKVDGKPKPKKSD